MYFAKDFKIKAAHKFEFRCGFYFCVIGALKYIIGNINYMNKGLHHALLPLWRKERFMGFA